MSLISPTPLSAIKSNSLLFSSPIPSPRFLRSPSRHRRRSKLRSERNGVSATITTSETQARSNESKAPAPPTFQQAIQRLQVGAGTLNPSTFLRVLGPEPWNVAYVEFSIRPDDSRYGDNPNRLQRHTQFQAGSFQLQPVSVEITYGLELILMLLQTCFSGA